MSNKLLVGFISSLQRKDVRGAPPSSAVDSRSISRFLSSIWKHRAVLSFSKIWSWTEMINTGQMFIWIYFHCSYGPRCIQKINTIYVLLTHKWYYEIHLHKAKIYTKSQPKNCQHRFQKYFYWSDSFQFYVLFLLSSKIRQCLYKKKLSPGTESELLQCLVK